MHCTFYILNGNVYNNITEVEITVGHRTFSVHIAQMAELSCVCADILSGHSLEQ